MKLEAISYVVKEQVAKKLGITADNVEKVAKEYNIEKRKEKGSVYTYLKKKMYYFLLINKMNYGNKYAMITLPQKKHCKYSISLIKH